MMPFAAMAAGAEALDDSGECGWTVFVCVAIVHNYCVGENLYLYCFLLLYVHIRSIFRY